jgi:hypothetical protein
MEMGIEKGMRQIPYEAPILAIDTGSNKGIDGLMMEIDGRCREPIPEIYIYLNIQITLTYRKVLQAFLHRRGGLVVI